MTQLLKQAFKAIEKLPDDTQNAIAARLLAELEDELAWEASFARTTDAQWERLEEMARKEIAAGDYIALHEYLR